jgi:CRP/FNR family transcriptional regulator, cyclic AMP receptor protein
MDIERLRRLSLFGELDHHDLSMLARWVIEVEAADGDLLIEQGSLPHRFFVIEEGTADVLRDGRRVATLGPGDVAGEMGLVKLQRRSASVRATSQIRAVALDAEGLAAVAEHMPEVADQLRNLISRRDSGHRG